ncbi:putative G-protein coupled receptor 158, partial [Corvus brachyrhynchos]
CRPCRPGCATCEDDTPCLIQEDPVLRAAVLSCQACCMLAIFLSMLVSYHFRRSKARIRTSGIILLETILFGSLLLYFPVFILYFKPSIFRCIVLRWGCGFGEGWGLRTPKAGRVWVLWTPKVRAAGGPCDGEGMGIWDPHGGEGWGLWNPTLGRAGVPVGWARGSGTPHWDGLGSQWDGLGALEPHTGTGWGPKLLFLLWGSFLCYATRAVPSAFHEPRYMGIALHNELVISAAFHVVSGKGLGAWAGGRLWGLEVGRGLCGSCSGPALLVPSSAPPPLPAQFLHTGSPLREEITAEVYEDELDMRRSGSCMNSSIASAWSEHSLDPDDIR